MLHFYSFLIKTLIRTYAQFKGLVKRLKIDNKKWPYKGKYMNYEAFNEI